MKSARAKFGAVTRNKEIYVVGGIKGFRSEVRIHTIELKLVYIVFRPNDFWTLKIILNPNRDIYINQIYTVFFNLVLPIYLHA